MLSFSFILLVVSEKKIFEYFFENLPFISPCQPTNLNDLERSRMKRGGLLNKHFCKKNQISQMTQQKLSISTFPIVRARSDEQFFIAKFGSSEKNMSV